MEFRKSGSRDERRRRVLIDEAQAEPPLADENPPIKRIRSKSENAAPAARYEFDGRQPRITDLLPKRKLTLSLWVVVAALLVAALTACDTYRPLWQARLPQVDWSLLAMNSSGSLARWFASLAFAWAACAAIQVYVIRRQRTDDYRGGYRLWAWTAAALLLASADAATSLHATLGALGASLLGSPSHGRLAGLGLVAAATGGFGLRMIWEIKSSRGAVAALSLAAGCYLFAVLAGEGWTGVDASWMPAAGGAALLSAHAFVLLTVGVFGRFVYFEAHGLPAKTERKPKVRKSSEGAAKKRSAKTDKAEGSPADAAKRPAKTDVEPAKAKPPAAPGKDASADKRPPEPAKKPPETKSPSPAAAPAKPATKAPAPASDDDDEDDADDSPRLSKAERRKLRKQLRKAA
jgi:hypothetical protein